MIGTHHIYKPSKRVHISMLLLLFLLVVCSVNKVPLFFSFHFLYLFVYVYQVLHTRMKCSHMCTHKHVFISKKRIMHSFCLYFSSCNCTIFYFFFYSSTFAIYILCIYIATTHLGFLLKIFFVWFESEESKRTCNWFEHLFHNWVLFLFHFVHNFVVMIMMLHQV